jgi:carbamoyltransferase
MENLCLAGGVALNCVANGRLLREGPFKRLWIQPAAGDAGGALGVAYAVHHRYFEQERNGHPLRDESGGEAYWDRMKGTLLGPSFSETEIAEFLAAGNIPHERVERRRVADVAANVGEHSRLALGQHALADRADDGRRQAGNRCRWAHACAIARTAARLDREVNMDERPVTVRGLVEHREHDERDLVVGCASVGRCL